MASQTASPNIRIGANATDSEAANPTTGSASADDTTGTNDEDLSMPSFTVGSATNLNVPVTVNTAALSGSTARINVFVDWNGDGDVADAGETQTAQVVNASGTYTFSLTPPAGTTAGTKYLRIRVSEGSIPPSFSGASALKGEVEDYAFSVNTTGADYGDYSLLPSASNTANSTLRLGATVTAESATTGNASADSDTSDDGVSFSTTTPASGHFFTATVTVTNTTGANAYLSGWFDIGVRGNSLLTDTGETVVNNFTIPNNASAQTYTFVIGIPDTVTAGNTGLRFRLSSTASPSSSGNGGSFGEVEDYLVNITGSPPACGTELLYNPSFEYGFVRPLSTAFNTTGVADNFPNSTLSPTANARAYASATANYSPQYRTDIGSWVDFSGKASDGSKFVYLARNTTSQCLTIPLRYGSVAGSSTTNGPHTYLQPSKTYRLIFDWAAFDRAQTSGNAAETNAPNVELKFFYATFADITASGWSTSILRSPTTGAIQTTPQALQSWASLAWTRSYVDIPMPASMPAMADSFVIQISQTGSRGLLLDNRSLAEICPADYGDYPTFASASQSASADIRMGTNPTDSEAANPASGSATVDDGTGTDDEDLTMPSFTVGSATNLNVPVTVNTAALSGNTARLNVFVDWNGDGDVADSGETQTAQTVSASGVKTFNLTPPVGTSPGTKYLRVRITEGSTAPSFAGASSLKGEVEDYAISVYCPDALIVVPCYVNGDPLGGGTAGDDAAMVAYPVDATGNINFVSPKFMERAADIGSVFGVAYAESYGKIFTSAFTRRHAGFGPLGTSGIYVGEISGGTMDFVPFVRLDTLGIPGLDLGADPHSGLPADASIPNHDPGAYAAVAKTSFGDLDISEDERYLYTINLKQKTLMKIFIDSPAQVPTAADVQSFPIPFNPPTNFTWGPIGAPLEEIPFALKVHQGRVLVGIVYGGTDPGGFGYDTFIEVLAFDPDTNTFLPTPALAQRQLRDGSAGDPTVGDRWSDVWDITAGNASALMTDIEVDAAGNLYTLLTAREGYQTAWGNYSTDTSDTTLYDPVSTHGAIGRFPAAGTSWDSASGVMSWAAISSIDSQTTYYGGLAYDGANQRFIVPASAPIDYQSGGTVHVSAIDGSVTGGLTLFEGSGTQGKASGLGDMELICFDTTPGKDFGDYPGFPSADHVVSGSLHMGVASTDAETSNPVVGSATADDTTGTDDEDLTMPTLLTGASAKISVPVIANTPSLAAGTARLGAFVDWNGDGDVADAGETIASQSIGGSGTYFVTLAPPVGTTPGTKYLRLRITEGASAPPFSGSSPLQGEVEDYAITVNNPLTNAACFKLLVGNQNIDTISQYEGATGAYLGILSSGLPIESPSDLLPLGDGSFLAAMGNGQNSIEKFSSLTGSFAGNFALAGTGGLDTPASSVLGRDGYAYFVSNGSNSVIRFDAATGTLDSVWLSAADGLDSPVGIAIDFAQNLYVSNFNGHEVRKYNSAGNFVSVLHTYPPTELPRGMTVGPDGRLYVIVNTFSPGIGGRIDRFDLTTGVRSTFVTMDAGSMPAQGILWGPDGNLYVNDFLENEVQVYSSAGAVVRTISTGLNGPCGIAIVPCSPMDFGDLPAPYPTSFASNGPRHYLSNALKLGASVDPEADGPLVANGDDLDSDGDDEDGVTFPAFAPGATSSVTITSSGAGKLNAFFDWNADGDFADAGEVIAQMNVVAGSNSLSVSVPATVATGTPIGARFRLSSAGGLTAVGGALDGEVEDYLVIVQARVAIGSTVWLDTGPNRTANGSFDIGEGLNGVVVELYRSSDTPGIDAPVATMLTAGDGTYQFDNLQPGDYIVYLPNVTAIGQPLSGKATLTGGSIDDNTDNDDDGLDVLLNGGIRSSVINLTPGAEITGEPSQALYTGTLNDNQVNMTVDFGFETDDTAIGIGSVVFIDGRGLGTLDGTYDHPNEGVDGVTVSLYFSYQTPGIDPPYEVTRTTNGGHYYFDCRPGTYKVYIRQREFASGALAGTSPLPGAGGDDGIDNDDNGLDAWVNGGIVTSPIALTLGGEPTGEDQTGYSGGVADNSIDATVDLGFLAGNGTVALGSRVWNDDGDGIFQYGEGVTGVTIELHTDPNKDGDFSDGTLVAKTTTSEDGFYLFDQLVDGNYVVHIPAKEFASGPLAGATSLPGFDSGNLDEESGSNENGVDTPVNGGISSNSITLTQNGAPTGELSQRDYQGTLDDNDVNMTIDFAFTGALPDPALGNAVFADRNGNGVMDIGEGVNGVAVELYTSRQTPGVDTPLRQTITTVDGNYLFDLLPDDFYVVYLPAKNFSPGAPLYEQQSLPGAGGDDTHDDNVDENGLDVPVNGGIASAIILIREGGEPVQERGSASGPTSVLPDDSANYTIDFGFEPARTGAIGNRVWIDENSDGHQDAGEPGLAGVTVQLKDSEGAVIQTTVTDSDGGYLFGALISGQYWVDIDDASLPAGMTQTPSPTTPGADLGNQDHSGGGYPVAIGGSEPNKNLTADFGYNYNPAADVNGGTNTAALGDRVWIDSDGDGLHDPGEIGVKGVTLTLMTAGADRIFGTADDAIKATTTTNASGHYIFDGLVPDAYQVRVTDSASASHNIRAIGQFSQTEGMNAPVVLGPGDVFLNADFGYVPVITSLGSIGNTVWLDIDADGVQDTGEPGIAGVTVTLVEDTVQNGNFDPGEKALATATTNSSGEYLFTGLAVDKNYLIWVNDTNNVLAGMSRTYDSNGSAGSPDVSAVAITTTQRDDRSQNFGYTTGQLPGSIGNFVWLDIDSDGVQDEVAAGIQGVIMELLDASRNVVATTRTNGDGFYLFDGLPVNDGTGKAGVAYSVRIGSSNFRSGGVLEGYRATYDPDNSTISPDGSGGIVDLTAASPHNWQQDFGYYSAALGSIGSTVWYDTNNSGGNQATQGSEPGIPCVLVSLYADDGDGNFEPNTGDSLIAQEYTDSRGNYLFDRLPLGATYFVEVDVNSLPDFVIPASTYEETLSGESIAGNNVSDATPTVAKPHVLDQDFSYAPVRLAVELGYIGDYVGFEDGLAGVTVALKNGANVEVARTTTGADGRYAFIGLPLNDGGGDGDADYSVAIDTSTLPHYVSRISSHDGSDGGNNSTSRVALSAAHPIDVDQDFTYPKAVRLGAIGSRLWLDADGENDTDEAAGLESVIVELLNNSGNRIAVATTDENGTYLFAGLPLATYRVRVADENFAGGGVLQGMKNTGTATSGSSGDTLPAIALTSIRPVDLGQNFGYRSEATQGTISSLVWLDRDADGVFSTPAGDTRLKGISVALYRDLDGNGAINPGDPRIATTTSGLFGQFLFKGLPVVNASTISGGSDYLVDITDIDGVLGGHWHTTGMENTPGNSQTLPGSFSLSAAAPTNIGTAFGYYRDLATLGNRIWFDTDRDGQQDSGEPGKSGVQVTLEVDFAGGSKVLLKTVSDDQGHYGFSNLLADEDHTGGKAGVSYRISVATPEAMVPTLVDRATDLDDSDAHSGVTAIPVRGSNHVAVNPVTNEHVSASYDFGFIIVTSTNTFTIWQQTHDQALGHTSAPGTQDGPMANADADLYNNLIEYALHTDPGSGIQICAPFFIEKNSATGKLNAVFVRNFGGNSDVSYTLEARDTLVGDGSDATAWFDVTNFFGDSHVAITDNGDGTETVKFVDLEDIDLPLGAGKLNNGEGYVRLRIDGSGSLSGNTSFTQTFGWLEQVFRAQHETGSDPFVKADLFTGVVTSFNGKGNTIDVSGSIGTGNLGAILAPSKQYYLEVIAGDHVGHRLEIDEAATRAGNGKAVYVSSTGGEALASTSSLENLPVLVSDTIALREHRTLSELCPADAFAATNSHTSADRILFFNGINSFDITWMYDGSVHDGVHRWVERRTVTYADIGSSRIIHPAEAFYVEPQSGSVSLLQVGAVRANPFVQRLQSGWNFVGNPWPADRHAAPDQVGVSPDRETTVSDLGMTTANGFHGNLSVGKADKIQLWSADRSENFGVEGYTGYYLLQGDLTSLGLGMRNHWTKVSTPNLEDQNTAPVLLKGRGMFLDMQNAIDRWVIPAPTQ
ncbi:MAG: SdrD B-like domain-containing protein [Verrucomicrobiales bacterium]